MRVGIMGSTEATLGDGSRVDLGTRKQRAVLAALVLADGRPAHPDALADLVWGEEPPAAVAGTLQAYVSRLRKSLEPGRAARTAAEVLVSRDGGYALVLPAGALDSQRFEAAVRAVHPQVAPALAPGELERLRAELDEGLALWRGTPYVELGDAPSAQAERARLEELRLVALEDRAALDLHLGRHATVAAELEVLTSTHPLRERLWGLRALALTRAGRQADALDVLQQVRTLLVEELGLEPGAELRDLQSAVLRQDPSLGWVPHQRPAPVEPPRGAVGEWPLIGRDAQLEAVVELLDRPDPGFAVVTGEPGIGKSRLCTEVVAAAHQRGATVLVGRCSQDEGAPPLFPWAHVLRGLDHELPRDVDAAGDDAARFRAWEQIVRTVTDAARATPLLVVLDDLHWADTSTLRVLRLLAETADSGRLTTVVTWRDDPAPTGPLAEVAEALARRHATRVVLQGLAAADVAAVVASVAQTTPTEAEAAALRERTDGNPFFLVEYARLARGHEDLASLLGEEDPPAAVQEVLTRRIAALPEDTARMLRLACVLGRAFDVPTLARLAERDDDEVLDLLDPALEAGLVREVGVDRFRFAHALVRDTAYALESQSRRARLHARAAAVLAGTTGRESEVARHWLAAGPLHASRAWRAADAAARAATRVFAYDEAAQLLGRATEAIRLDEAATPREEHDLLLHHVEALQRIGRWVDLRAVVHRAVTIAQSQGDLDALVRATTVAMDNALWQSGSHMATDVVVVGALRDALERLPGGDSVARCRVMLSLAGEIYYDASAREREALADEGLAMARRLGDAALLQWALLSAYTSIWRGGTAHRRVDLATEAAALARAAGDQVGLSAALTLLTVASGEIAWDPDMPARLAAARDQARAQRHHYAEMVLAAFEVPWLAMRGQGDDVDALIAEIVHLGEVTALAQAGDAVGGAVLTRAMWLGDDAELSAAVQLLAEHSALPVSPVLAALWCRAGERETGLAYLEDHPVDLVTDDWFSPMAWALTAELSVHLGRRDLAEASYTRLLTLRGRPACAGSGAAVGPADAFLAMAAHAVGERDLATRHADDAARLCEEWEVPLVASWWAEQRERLGL